MSRKFSFLLGGTLLTIPAVTLIFATVIFLLGGTLNGVIFPIAVLAALGISYWLNGKEQFCKLSLWTICIVMASVVFMGLIYDYSGDGQIYHQETIIALRDGWNPIWQCHSLGRETEAAICTDHYCRGLETVSAAIFSTTGNVECGKAVNAIMVLASGSLFYSLLLSMGVGGRFKRFIIAALFTLNPVVLAQWLTYYTDWAMYALLLSLVSILVGLQEGDRRKYIYAGTVIVLAVSIKLNCFFWVGMSVIIYMGWLLMSKKYSDAIRWVWAGTISVILGVFLVGLNPYVTNTIDHGHPAYPLMGDNPIDIMTGNEVPEMRKYSSWEKVFVSYTSYPSNDTQEINPFALGGLKKNIPIFAVTDTRIGGFGPWFFMAILLSVVVYCFCRVDDKKKRYAFGTILVSCFVGLFVLPGGWWARYVPFFWAVPLIMLLYSEFIVVRRWVGYVRVVTYIVITANVAIYMAVPAAFTVYNASKIKYIVSRIKSASQVPVIYFGDKSSFKQKLKNIEYIEHTVRVYSLDEDWEDVYMGVCVSRETPLGEGEKGFIWKMIDKTKRE